MTVVSAYAVQSPGEPLAPWSLERRDLRAHDVRIDIAFCGVCHSDIHQAHADWGQAIFPMVPGHEITGTVAEIGPGVTRYSVGDRVGVGVFVEACRECPECLSGEDQYCSVAYVGTYNYRDRDGQPTYGGYATGIVVDENFVFRIPDSLPLDAAAPLLCAGITTYTPLSIFGAGPGMRVAIMGLGGLGHMGVKFARAMGADVTVLSHSPSKEADALALGAHHFIASSDSAAMAAAQRSFDLIVDTVSAPHDIEAYLRMLAIDGTLCIVGLPTEKLSLSPFALVVPRRRLAGSMIGGTRRTQEMLDFCGEHGIVSEIEMITAPQLNEAWERVVASDVRYRFVVDTSTIA